MFYSIRHVTRFRYSAPVRESLPDLLRELGFSVRAFTSAEEFLASDCVGQTQCLILDVTRSQGEFAA